eukprot:9370793-Alexandrium_andersonii.AAC.1
MGCGCGGRRPEGSSRARASAALQPEALQELGWVSERWQSAALLPNPLTLCPLRRKTDLCD